MANLIEEAKWEDGIYQLEVTDPVVGGPDGIDNRQAKELANRTSYLKQKLESGLAPESLLEEIKKVDGIGSELDADLLDGLESSAFAKTSSFASIKYLNGYQKLEGGLIIQWGTVYQDFLPAEGLTVTFPIAFPNSVFQVVGVHRGSVQTFYMMSPNSTKTSFTLLAGNALLPKACSWIAIGH